jgi:hypothetical protein
MMLLRRGGAFAFGFLSEQEATDRFGVADWLKSSFIKTVYIS